MNMLRSIVRRLHRIVVMPAYVMGLDAPQSIISTPLWETQPATKS